MKQDLRAVLECAMLDSCSVLVFHHKAESITPCLSTVTFFYKLCNSVKANNDIVVLFCIIRFYHSALRLSFFDGKAAVTAIYKDCVANHSRLFKWVNLIDYCPLDRGGFGWPA